MSKPVAAQISTLYQGKITKESISAASSFLSAVSLELKPFYEGDRLHMC